MNKSKYEDRAKIFKAFCDENRLMILDMLKTGEKCACALLDELQITQPTLSHHMKILCDSGIVAGRKDGKWTHYSINKDGMKKAQNILDGYTNTADTVKTRSCCCIPADTVYWY